MSSRGGTPPEESPAAGSLCLPASHSPCPGLVAERTLSSPLPAASVCPLVPHSQPLCLVPLPVVRHWQAPPGTARQPHSQHSCDVHSLYHSVVRELCVLHLPAQCHTMSTSLPQLHGADLYPDKPPGSAPDSPWSPCHCLRTACCLPVGEAGGTQNQNLPGLESR